MQKFKIEEKETNIITYGDDVLICIVVTKGYNIYCVSYEYNKLFLDDIVFREIGSGHKDGPIINVLDKISFDEAYILRKSLEFVKAYAKECLEKKGLL